MKEDFLDNINMILTEGKIEGKKLENIEVLKELFEDKDIDDMLYKRFNSNLQIDFEEDDLLTKVQDLVYRMNLLVDNLIVPIIGNKDIPKIKNEMRSYIKSDIDLYSAVSYDDSDKDFLDEIELDYNESMRI